MVVLAARDLAAEACCWQAVILLLSWWLTAGCCASHQGGSLLRVALREATLRGVTCSYWRRSVVIAWGPQLRIFTDFVL